MRLITVFSAIFSLSFAYAATPSAPTAPVEVNDLTFAIPMVPKNEQDLLAKAHNFLSNIKTLKGKFIQVTTSPNGMTESRTGSLKWLRPGYVRFDYEGQPLLQVASDGESFRQKDEDGVSLPIAIESTPAGLILKNTVDFKRDAVIKHVVQKDGFALITLATKEDPEGATLTLIFKVTPFHLAQWTTIDTAGFITDVILMDIQLNTPMKKSEFDLK